MAGTNTERKQVLRAGDKIDQFVSMTSKPTPKIADGSLHGLIQNLTYRGLNYIPPV